MILLKYTCAKCSLVDAEVEVPDRKPGEDIAVWMRYAISYVRYDHGHRSPWCFPKSFTNIKIPITDGRAIGSATTMQ